MTGPRRISILGVPVDCVDMDSAVAAAARLLDGDRARTVLAVNPEKVMAARDNPDLLDMLNASGLCIPDGIGVVWAARLLGLGRFRRVPGVDMMAALCAYAAGNDVGVFLFGARQEVLDAAVANLQRRYPGLPVAGSQNGYVSDDGMPAVIEKINASGAKILFVALGSPKQELWMRQFGPSLDVRVCQGVGGSFDVFAGNVKRAPALFRAMHLEWFYRLLSQPQRLFRQSALPRFAWLILAARFGRKVR